MLPGTGFICRCSFCGNCLKRESINSGNTFGDILYSDGKRISSMLPGFPNLTKCRKCNNIFWIRKWNKVGEYEFFRSKEEVLIEWKNADIAEFLDIKDLFRALEAEENIYNEICIRKLIWWTFNDRVREDTEELFLEESEKALWRRNCKSLLNLLYDYIPSDQLMIAELYRNLGEFEDCIRTIDNIENTDKKWIKDTIKFHAEKQFSLCVAVRDFYGCQGNSVLPAFQKRGELKEKRGDYKSALKDYEKAIAIDDKNPILYVLISGVHEKLEQYDLTLEYFNKALSMDSNNSDAYINRSLFYRRRKQYEDAKKDYDKAISLEPRIVNIVSFSEIDIFKYGKLTSISIVDSNLASISTFKEGTLHIDVFWSHYKNSETDTSLWLDPKKIPYFIFRKNHPKPILNKRFVKFEFLLAKIIFYIRVYIFRRKARFINDAVLN